MISTNGEFILSRSNITGGEIVGAWHVEDDDIIVHLLGKHYRVECRTDMRTQLYWFVRTLEKEHICEPIQLNACATCEYFSVSGMSLDMAHGHIGNCNLHQKGVSLCYLCKDFTRTKLKDE